MSEPKIDETERHRITDIHEFGIDTKLFVVYLQGVENALVDEDGYEPGVEFMMANRFIKNLDILAGMDPDRPITVSMKTNGGFVEEGMAMYDAIRSTPNPIVIVNYTHARSMSSIIFQAANKRVMMPHSSFMFHMGEEWVGGTTKQARSGIEWNKRNDQVMFDVYIDAIKATPNTKMSGWSRARIEKWLKEEMDKKEDVYFTAEETVALGFADEIFTTWEAAEALTSEQIARKNT